MEDMGNGNGWDGKMMEREDENDGRKEVMEGSRKNTSNDESISGKSGDMGGIWVIFTRMIRANQI